MKRAFWITATCMFLLGVGAHCLGASLEEDFTAPPESARPWVYWMFMDGNLTREGMTADLEAMQRAGIGGAIFMEVDIGIPRGPVKFMSPQWRDLLSHAFAEADRLGLEIALSTGPGWCGTGGPWVKPEQSMQHLVASEATASGPVRFDAVLPKPQPRTPFFGENTLTPELHKVWKEFYRDVAVLAFPTPEGNARIADVDEKALFFRAPYSSQPGVKPFLPAPAEFAATAAQQCVSSGKILDLTDKLDADGRLAWDVPKGNWTILRLGRTITGQTTRPAPAPGLGLESDKFDAEAIDAHIEAYVETLLKTAGEPKRPGRGLTMLHFDSWEMSSQNWSGKFREEFKRRRGYDLLRFLPAMFGRVVDSMEVSERFLWDLRRTAEELVVENHALRLKELGRRHGLSLSIEPYDLNPCSDLKLGAVADVPMCEFWSKGWGFSTEFSCIEAASIAHTLGRKVVAAEAFTAAPGEDWRQYPGSMKPQGDWALCTGVNRFTFHRYQAQPALDQFPGMTFGPYGVHWERTQTWWDMVSAYHAYLARCQQMLRRGLFVTDILYLAPEGAPHVFRPPASALDGDLPDRKGYNFDGCGPDTLIERAEVKDGRIVFSDGMSYRLLVLPRFDTMTPQLLAKIERLVQGGAVVLGAPPKRSPSLVEYPNCDRQVAEIAARLWGEDDKAASRDVGKGRVILDAEAATSAGPALDRSLWIWHAEGNPAASAPAGKRFFRRQIEIDPARPIQSAQIAMTADNTFELFVNGQSAGAGDNFHHVYTMDVTGMLKPGVNSLTVTAENTSDQPNPAGIIGCLTVRYRDGNTTIVATDRQWSSATSQSGQWAAAMELGRWGMAPWGKPASASTPLYPDYAATARALSEMGVPPDFEGDGLRYIHRRDGEVDLYFIANKGPQAREVACRFRIAGRRPEWWNPVSGEHRDLPQFSIEGQVTLVPISLAPYESGFVVFRKPNSLEPTPAAGANFPQTKPFLTLGGPWEVAFEPKWGGPEKITFDKLDDWSKRPDDGIQHYSGKAVYRKSFDFAGDANAEGYSLSLGTVHVMASVRLNDKDLGIVWCDPWRVKVPAGVLRAQGNQLEVTVANLWCNRLIGDSALPAEKRLTRTTYNPFRPNTPLLPSGLLGPVAVEKSEQ